MTLDAFALDWTKAALVFGVMLVAVLLILRWVARP